MRLTRKSLAVVGAAALVLVGLPGVGHTAPAAAITQVGDYFPVTPSRILDTREGNGAPKHTVGADQTLTLQVAGRGGVPSTGVSAVVLNVTVANTSSASFMTVYPTGISRPNASNLNITKGWVGANSVTVKLGTGGAVNLYNQAGTLDVIADVTGYYAATDGIGAAGTGGEMQPFTAPFREIDTRDGYGALQNGDTIELPFGTLDNDVNSHIKAAAINVTAVDANAPGFFTAWSGIGSAPNASLVNFTAGSIVPNYAIVPTMPCTYSTDICPTDEHDQSFTIKYTGGGSVDLIVDIIAFVDDNTVGGGLHFTPSDPVRIVDTRSGLGISSPLGNDASTNMVVPAADRDDNTFAISANVTGVNPTAKTFVQLWPTSEPQPAAGSTLNLNPGDVKPNAALVGIDDDWSFSVYNLRGTTNLVMDMNGIYDALPSTATKTAQLAHNGGSRKFTVAPLGKALPRN